ncbi:hypothetical protein, partial [Serratia fonticola]|uniref:hypothetical protein n=1 Tax=Serratia fonticola TaxID=47917 RepID=UPI0019669756
LTIGVSLHVVFTCTFLSKECYLLKQGDSYFSFGKILSQPCCINLISANLVPFFTYNMALSH